MLGFNKYNPSLAEKQSRPLQDPTSLGQVNGISNSEILSEVCSQMTVHDCLSYGILSRFMNKRLRELLSLRWLEMKLGLLMEEFQDLRTHLNLNTDLTGRFARIFSTKSCGRWFLRIGGSLIEDIFQRKDRETEGADSRSVCCSDPNSVLGGVWSFTLSLGQQICFCGFFLKISKQ